MPIAPSNRLLTLGLVLCVAGLGAGIGIARLSGGSSSLGLAGVAEAVQSGSAARATVRPAELVTAAPLPSLGAAPKRRVVHHRTARSHVTAATPVATPHTVAPTPVVVPPPVVVAPPPPPPPATESATPLH